MIRRILLPVFLLLITLAGYALLGGMVIYGLSQLLSTVSGLVFGAIVLVVFLILVLKFTAFLKKASNRMQRIGHIVENRPSTGRRWGYQVKD